MTIIDVAQQFASEEACINYLEAMRWPDGVECLKCSSKRVSRYIKQEGVRTRVNPKTGKEEEKRVPARCLYVCLDCQYQFSVTEGTTFNDTHLPLNKWFHAVALMCNAKKGVSSLQLQRDVGMAKKTAWYLGHRIRKAMGLIEQADETPLTGTVEVDEAYMGAKKWDSRRKRPRYAKTPVFGMVERDGRARTFHVQNVSMKRVMQKITDNVAITADAIYSDESRLYDRTKECLENRNHQTVNHMKKEWVRGPVHTGTIDGFWGLLKRGIIGSFHQISVKHLHRYLSEFQFKWNNRKNPEMFSYVIAALVIGATLPYAKLIAIAQDTPTPAENAEADNEEQPF